MSWNFKKAGSDKEALKAAVQAENAPSSVKDRVCDQIDGIKVQEGQIIVVRSEGHFEAPQFQPTYGESTEKTSVHIYPLINTPLAV